MIMKKAQVDMENVIFLIVVLGFIGVMLLFFFILWAMNQI